MKKTCYFKQGTKVKLKNLLITLNTNTHIYHMVSQQIFGEYTDIKSN